MNRHTPKTDTLPCAPWQALESVFAYTFQHQVLIDSEKALNVELAKEEIKSPKKQKTCSAMHSILLSW